MLGEKMLAWSELGADILEQSDDGYNVIVGSLLGRLITFGDSRRTRTG